MALDPCALASYMATALAAPDAGLPVQGHLPQGPEAAAAPALGAADWQLAYTVHACHV